MRKLIPISLFVLFSLPAHSAVTTEAPENVDRYRGWIEEMKGLDRGPFSRLRWFCNDGTVFPPRSYACREHGGGHQHGEWSEKTVELRDQGYLVANVLAGLDVDAALDDPGFRDFYAQLLIERFLVGADDGWIFRRAQFYRGAIQEEDERAAARELLIAMASRQDWIGPGFPALRAGVRTLPHGLNTPSIQKVRQDSASLSGKDPAFKPLRAKIHGSPGAEEADAVRAYAAALRTEEARQPYLELAAEIDGIYRASPLDEALEDMAARYTAAPWLQDLLTTRAAEWRDDPSAAGRFMTSARLLADLRRNLHRVRSSGVRLELLDLEQDK